MRLIPFLNQFEIRREAADSAIARQGEATTYRIDLEMELQLVPTKPHQDGRHFS